MAWENGLSASEWSFYLDMLIMGCHWNTVFLWKQIYKMHVHIKCKCKLHVVLNGF
jgi:hypothetical protein